METVTVRMLDTITRKYEHTDHSIYTVDEADELKITYHQRPFTEKMKIGDWILTDDGMVVQILKYIWNDFASRWQIRIPNGTFFVDPPGRNRNQILAKLNMPIKCQTSSAQRGKRINHLMFAFAMVVTGFDVAQSFEYAFQRKLTTRRDMIIVRNLLSNPQFMSNVMKKVEEVYDRSGVAPESIIQRIDELLQNLVVKAKESTTAGDIIALTTEGVKVAQVLGEMAGFEQSAPTTQALLLQRSTLKLIKQPEETIFDEDVIHAATEEANKSAKAVN